MNQPLYQRIYDDLKQRIQSGELPYESQLPTEKELSEIYQVSRITSKRALTELEQAGLIYRVQGRGSFVCPPHKNKSTNKILFVLPFANDLSLGNFNEGIYETLQKSGYDLMITPLDYLEEHHAASIIRDFAGLIYYPDNTETLFDLLFELAENQFPVITLDKKLHDFPFPAVLSDNFLGGKLATQQLIDSGHQTIAYLFGEAQHPQSVRQRYLGYVSALNQHDIVFRTKLADQKALVKNAVAYIEENQITAAICENDLVAIELARKLKASGYQLPQDFSVIGFDNIQAAALIDPPLTTVAQDFAALGRLAADGILSLIQEKKVADQLVPVSLVLRDSTTTKESKNENF